MFNFAADFITDEARMTYQDPKRRETNEGLFTVNEPITAIDDEVLFLDNLQDAVKTSSIKLEYNAIVHCREGRVIIEMGGNQQVIVKKDQLLLVPAYKLVQPMMVSTDVSAGALLVSDKVLKSVLGNEINIWNRAMYTKEIYVVDGKRWTHGIEDYTKSVFNSERLFLHNEIVMAFLRTFFLTICESLIRTEKMSKGDDTSNTREKSIFNEFLELLSSQKQKRHQVAYYANELCITPKHLSTICRKVSGKTPTKWITDSVMEDSYMLLRSTSLSIKEISNRLGFPNSSFFGQYFREQAGITPMKYRTEHRTAI